MYMFDDEGIRYMEVTIPLIGIFCFLRADVQALADLIETLVTIPLIGIFCFLPQHLGAGCLFFLILPASMVTNKPRRPSIGVFQARRRAATL